VELKQIKELMAAMERAGIKKLSIKEKTGFEIQLERQEELSYSHPLPPPVYSEPRFPTHAHHPPKVPHVAEESLKEKKEEKVEGRYVISPMVGTFYAASSPEDSPFVKVGDRVDENTVVCIIEAMKVMNEVKAGVSGVIAEICVENAHPVEFGTKIFRIV
jgi:acetyl-CoA carboxylase biotin carboxyl carrier protein